MTMFSAVLLVTLLAVCSISSQAEGAVMDDGHGHGHGTASLSCAVTDEILAHEFSELAAKFALTGEDGHACSVEDDHDHEKEDEHGHDDEDGDDHDEDGDDHGHEEDGNRKKRQDEDHGHEDDDDHEDGDEHTEDGRNVSSSMFCDNLYHFTEDLLLRLNLTTPCCLGNESSCTDGGANIVKRTSASKAYGYGFLMVVLVSLASLLGLFLVPFIKSPRLKSYYQYIYALLISLGASALFCDAILHLIPEAFGLHNHGHEPGEEEEEEGEDELVLIWRSCVIILGMYIFFIFEFVLHSCGGAHSHSLSQSDSTENITASSDLELQSQSSTKKMVDNGCTVEATFPHGTCKEGKAGGILHPNKDDSDTSDAKEQNYGKRIGKYILGIKPLAWLILAGDSLHNFADGLALGASISQSLSLGISTTIALIFHEIPHELGDFFILLSTGMSWYVALAFNFVSALTAVLGFFVGVAIGTSSDTANNWILALAAGIFIYIALVDLLPELIHIKEKSCKRFVLFVMVNIGFIISFIALLLLAIYEEDLNTLFV